VGAVIGELGDAVADVVERAMIAGLARSGGVEVGVPALHQLLHRRHVDGSIMQVVLDVGEICRKEPSVGTDAVATKGHALRCPDMGLDEGERLLAGFLEGHLRLTDLGQ
jgi:hypothetical protein